MSTSYFHANRVKYKKISEFWRKVTEYSPAPY